MLNGPSKLFVGLHSEIVSAHAMYFDGSGKRLGGNRTLVP